MEGITRLWPFTRWLLCSIPPLPQPKTSHILTLVDVTPPGSKSSIWRASLGCDPSPDDCFAPPLPSPNQKLVTFSPWLTSLRQVPSPQYAGHHSAVTLHPMIALLHPSPPPTKTLSHSHLGWRHSARFQVLNMQGITRLWPFTRWLLCSTPPLPQPKTSHILTLVDVTPSSSKSSIWRASLGCDPSPDDCFAPPLPSPNQKLVTFSPWLTSLRQVPSPQYGGHHSAVTLHPMIALLHPSPPPTKN